MTSTTQRFKNLFNLNETFIEVITDNLGVMISDESDFEIAENYYTEALSIRKKLIATNPEAYLPSLAESFNNIGLLSDFAKKAKTTNSK